MVVPQNRWFTVEILFKNGDLGVPLGVDTILTTFFVVLGLHVTSNCS